MGLANQYKQLAVKLNKEGFVRCELNVRDLHEAIGDIPGQFLCSVNLGNHYFEPYKVNWDSSVVNYLVKPEPERYFREATEHFNALKQCPISLDEEAILLGRSKDFLLNFSKLFVIKRDMESSLRCLELFTKVYVKSKNKTEHHLKEFPKVTGQLEKRLLIIQLAYINAGNKKEVEKSNDTLERIQKLKNWKKAANEKKAAKRDDILNELRQKGVDV